MALTGQSEADAEQARREKLAQASDLLRRARYAVALTGAGLSTPSGIPDFRSPESGLWADYDPFEVASTVSFRREPRRFFDWIRPLVRLMSEAEPNPAHTALARLEALGILRALITQNIDMLHTRAGVRNVYEVHGHLRLATCVECFREYETEPFLPRLIEQGVVPRCPHCGAVLKPNVVLFGEALPIRVLRGAQREARLADVMLIAGSSLEVAPASDMPLIARAYGAQLIVINYDETYIDDEAAVVIHDDVARAIPDLVDLIESGNAT